MSLMDCLVPPDISFIKSALSKVEPRYVGGVFDRRYQHKDLFGVSKKKRILKSTIDRRNALLEYLKTHAPTMGQARSVRDMVVELGGYACDYGYDLRAMCKQKQVGMFHVAVRKERYFWALGKHD